MGLTFFDEKSSDLFASPSAAGARASVTAGNEGSFLADINPTGFTIQIPTSVESDSPGQSQYLVAVRRDTNPQLAGRSYRLMGKGIIAQAGKFEVFALSPEENTLTIAANGLTATETNKIDWFAADFNGQPDQGSDGPFTLDYDITAEWHAKSLDGSIFFLRREEADGGLEVSMPPALLLPANPTIGQSWTNGSRELEVLDINGTSPNGITGCIVIRETSDNFIDTIWFENRVIIAIREQDPDGIEPDEVLYRTGP